MPLIACTLGGGAGFDGFGLFDEVYQCTDGSATVEFCYDGDPADIAGGMHRDRGGIWTCEPTPRHLGTCWYSCPTPSHGCNALNGCYCEGD